MSLISPLDSLILGVVEGVTEYLPVSSTGHLILTSHWLGLPDNEGVDAFNVVIQAGALLAVIGLYVEKIKSMIQGLLGRDPKGLQLVLQLFIGFLPAAIIGLTIEKKIKEHLFHLWPVVVALAVGGIAMIVIERWRRSRAGGNAAVLQQGKSLADMTVKAALIIGCAQCLAMWPGTSRSMVTIVAALLLGFSPRAAAEFSFLLALPTLGAATAHDLLKHRHALMDAAGVSGLAIGFIVSCIVAWIAVEGFLAFLRRRGLESFGWYRVALAIVIVISNPAIHP